MRRQKLNVKWFASMAVVGVAAVGAVMAVSRHAPTPPVVTYPPTATTVPTPASTTTAAPTTTRDSGDIPAPATDVTPARAILLDGWSAAIVGTTPMSVTFPDGKTATIASRVMTAADVTTILARNPEAIRALVARTVTSDRSLTCSATGCATASGPVDLAALDDPTVASNPMHAVFAGWGLRGVRIADASTADAVTVGSFGDVSLTAGDTPVGAGFGRLFALAPSWLDGGPRDLIRGPLTDATSIPVPHVDALWAGPAVRAGAAVSLTVQQLTAWSSPTTGCQVGVLCVPAAQTSATLKMNPTASFARCDQRSLLADGRGAEVWFAAWTGTITVTLPAPIHQVGVYGTGTLPGGLGTPPAFAEGVVSFSFAATDMYDQTGLVAIAGVEGDVSAAGAWDETTVAEFIGPARFAVCPTTVPDPQVVPTGSAPATTVPAVPVTVPGIGTLPTPDPSGPSQSVTLPVTIPVPTVANTAIPGLGDPGTPTDVPAPADPPATDTAG